MMKDLAGWKMSFDVTFKNGKIPLKTGQGISRKMIKAIRFCRGKLSRFAADIPFICCGSKMLVAEWWSGLCFE